MKQRSFTGYNPRMAQGGSVFIGVEIGGTKLQVVAGTTRGEIVDRWRGSVVRAEGRPGICRQIDAAITVLRRVHLVRGIGVGFGGPVDWRSGRTAVSHQISGWENFELRQWLAKTTDLDVAVENDANLATLGEATAGAGAGFDPVFYVTLGSGVGGGCVVNGSLYHGAAGGEAEFGHLRLDRQGVIVEQRCSGWAVDERIRAAAQLHPQSDLARRLDAKPGGEAKHLAAALEEEDPIARQIVSDVGGDLGYALSHVVHLFHPGVIVIGGGLSMVGEALRRAVDNALSLQIMKAFAPGPQIRLAALGEDAVPVGALILAATSLEGAEAGS